MIFGTPASLRARMTWGFTIGFGAFVVFSGAAILLWSWLDAQNQSRRLCADAVFLMRREWRNNQTTRDKEHAKTAIDEINEDNRFAPVAVWVVDGQGEVAASVHVPNVPGSPVSPVSPSGPPSVQARRGPPSVRALRGPPSVRALRGPLREALPDIMPRLGKAAKMASVYHNNSGNWQGAVQNAPGENGMVVFFAAVDMRPAQAALRQQASLLLLLGVLAVGAASRAAWVLVGRTLQPIGQVSKQAALAAATASDALSAQLTPPSNDAEVRNLVKTLNALLARLHDNTRRREQWYAAAAHELRTPLTILSGSVEVALHRPRTQTEYEETLQSLQNQTRRLIALSEGVLLLSRLDATTEAEPAAPVLLGESCRQVIDGLGPLVEARALHVTLDFGGADFAVVAPPSHVAMLTRNLIENAVKYATDGGQVRVLLSSGAELRVFNTFDTSRDPVNFARIFEPFYREKHTKSAGSGLGLAICQRLADANDWHLEMAGAPGGVCVTVFFDHSTTPFGDTMGSNV